jgi:hypothetical protein
MVVVSNILINLIKLRIKFKTAVYMDQVYLCQKKEYIKIFNEQELDFVICFSKYWEKIAKDQGLNLKPTGVLEHGFNPMIHYPIPSERLARMFF